MQETKLRIILGCLGKMAKEKLAKMPITSNMVIDKQGEKELTIKTLQFSEKLKQIIRPKDQSDRTTFRRIAEFFKMGIAEGRYSEEIFAIVLQWATEAAGPNSRNPAAVFIKILKEETNYGKKTT